MRSPRQAFTLLELVLVMTILVMLAAISYPSIDAMYGSYRVEAAADQVRAAWAQARTHAMNEGRAYRFNIVPNKGNFRVAPDGNEYWSGRGEVPTDADPDNPALVLEDSLPKGIRFTTPDSPQATDDGAETSLPRGEVDQGMWSNNAIVFLPNGTVQDDASLWFHAQGARPVGLRLRALTGSVTTISPRTEGE